MGKGITIQPGDEQIDLGGACVIPGMTTGHWHGDYGGARLADAGKGYLGMHSPPTCLTAVAIENMGYAVASGITNVVGAGCSLDNDACMKLAMADGRVAGPRLRTAGLHVKTTANENDPSASWLHARERQNGLQVIGAELFADGLEERQEGPAPGASWGRGDQDVPERWPRPGCSYGSTQRE